MILRLVSNIAGMNMLIPRQNKSQVAVEVQPGFGGWCVMIDNLAAAIIGVVKGVFTPFFQPVSTVCHWV